MKAKILTAPLIPARFDSVVEGRLKISDLCIGCGDMEVMAEHPLFEGGLCKDCKVRNGYKGGGGGGARGM